MAQAVRAVIAGLLLALASALLSFPSIAQPLRTGPTWNELSAQDRQVLAPLAPDWDRWDLLRKNKWLAMAKRYPTLPRAEQERIQERMQGWAKLSSQERQQAREQFKGLKKLPPDQREALTRKWIEYQSLPPERRQELRQTPPATRGGTQFKPPAPSSPPSPPPSR